MKKNCRVKKNWKLLSSRCNFSQFLFFDSRTRLDVSRVLWIRGVRPSGSCRDVMPNYGQTTNLFTFCNFFCFTCKQKYYLPNRLAVENWVELPFKNSKSVQAFQSYSWKHEIFSFFVVFVIVVKMSKNGLIRPFLHQKLISWW